jgi:hypothetical protein
MASERQREANRRNGRRGGPKTEDGKERSRVNRVTHGLTATTLVVLRQENPEESEEILSGFRDSMQPQGSVEEALVLRLAHAHWRGLRSRRVETGMLKVSAKIQIGRARELENCPEHLDVHEAIGVGFLAERPERWTTWLRYDAAISREFFRTLDTLQRVQRERRRTQQYQQQQPPVSAPPPEPARVAAAPDTAAQVSDSGIRFDSQGRNEAVDQDIDFALRL